MKSFVNTLILAGVTVGIAPTSSAQATYTVVNIGSLEGAFYQSHGMSPDGRVTGTANGSDGRLHAFVWTYGGIDGIASNPQMRELPVVSSGAPLSEGLSVNSSGAVAGYDASYIFLSTGTNIATSGGPSHPQTTGLGSAHYVQHAAYWPPSGKGKDLGTISGSGYSYGRGINDFGEVTGEALANTEYHAFLWLSGKMVDLGTPAGETRTGAYGINQAGEVVGYTALGDQIDGGFLWTPNVPNGTTGTFASLGAFVPHAINDNDQIAGTITVSGASHAALYDHGSILDLNAPVPNSYAIALNNAGQVVGYYASVDGTGNHAFLWSDTNQNGIADPGEMQDLNNLIPAGSGWVLTGAVGITDNGWIACNGKLNGVAAGCVLMP